MTGYDAYWRKIERNGRVVAVAHEVYTGLKGGASRTTYRRRGGNVEVTYANDFTGNMEIKRTEMMAFNALNREEKMHVKTL